jgi:hypothetical protein
VRKRYLLDHGGAAWALARQLAPVARTAGRGVRCCTHLQVADGDDLLSGPDLESEGVAAAVDDGVEPLYSSSSGSTAVQQRIQTRRAERSLAGQRECRSI